MGRLGPPLVAIVCAACRPTAGFACDDDDACRPGVCEVQGWCSFDDPSCPSGRRFGHWAGDGLADECVAAPVADTGGTTASPTTGTSGVPATTSGATLDTDAASSSGGTPGTSTDSSASSGQAHDSTGEPTMPAVLVAWYPFDASARAGVVLDAVGDHPGVCDPPSCPAETQGVIGLAAGFDGVDDLVTVTHDAGLDLGATWSVAAWMQPDLAAGAGYQNLMGKPVSLRGVADSIELAVAEHTNAALGNASADAFGNLWVPLPPAPAPATWFHVVGTCDGTTLRLYVDGMLYGESAAVDTIYSDLPWTVGGGIDIGVPSTFFAGAIDELRLYRGTLDDEEIAALFADGNPQ